MAPQTQTFLKLGAVRVVGKLLVRKRFEYCTKSVPAFQARSDHDAYFRLSFEFLSSEYGSSPTGGTDPLNRLLPSPLRHTLYKVKQT